MDRTEVFVKEGAHGFEVDRHDMDTFIVWGGGGEGDDDGVWVDRPVDDGVVANTDCIDIYTRRPT